MALAYHTSGVVTSVTFAAVGGVRPTSRVQPRPPREVLASLENLFLNENQITDEGCAALASALRNGALPVLKTLDLGGNPASIEARTAVQSALSAPLSR